jgi:hypothetical protein
MNSCKSLYPARSDLIVAVIEVNQRCTLWQDSCKFPYRSDLIDSLAVMHLHFVQRMNASSVTHLSATMGRNPGEPVMGQVEWAETISGEFNSQDVANTLWAFSTMGRKPGKRTMGQLGKRTEAIFQASESCKRTVGVGDNWEAARGADDGAAWRGGLRRYQES